MQIIAEYIWLDVQESFRSKTKIFSLDDEQWWDLASYPIWNYDGSSTGDIPENEQNQTECLLQPIAIYDDPFNTNTDKQIYMLVLCNNYYIDENNEKIGVHNIMYYRLEEITKKLNKDAYLLGFEQEFFLINADTGRPFGITNPNAIVQGPYYCGIGINNVANRVFLQDTQSKLIKAGLQLTGFNYEVAPSQAEFQVCDYGIEAAFQLLILRYILIRNGELYGILVSFNNVVYSNDNINNSGCHINISNTNTRKTDNGIDYILELINELGIKTPKTENEFNYIFGNNNTSRLNGKLETSKWDIFMYGYGRRDRSIRIPMLVKEFGSGYLEDRRLGANVNPFNYLYYLIS